VLWTATNDEASYSSAAGATVAGRQSAIFLTRQYRRARSATGRVSFSGLAGARRRASHATPLVSAI
jgi:hypothetical protein